MERTGEQSAEEEVTGGRGDRGDRAVSSPAVLLEILREKGTPLGPWGDAVASVPRELFLPDEVEVGDEFVSRAISPARWLEVAYSDVSVTT